MPNPSFISTDTNNAGKEKREQFYKKVIKALGLNKLKIGIKLSGSIGLIIVCSLSLIIILSLNMISKTNVKQVEKDTFELLKHTGDSLKSTLREIDRLAMYLSRERSISNCVEQLNNADESTRDRLTIQIGNFTNPLYQSRVDTLLDIIISDKNGYFVLASEGNNKDLSKDYKDTIGIKEFELNTMNSFWLDTHTTDLIFGSRTNEDRTVSLFKSIYTPTSLNKSVGTLQISVRESALDNIVKSTELPFDGSFFVIGESGNIVLSPSNNRENGLLLNEVNKVDKTGKTLAEFLGKTDLTYQSEILSKPLFKIGGTNEVSDEIKNSLKEREGYLSAEIYEAVNANVKKLLDTENSSTASETFGEIVGNDFKVNGRKMKVAYYHIKSVEGTPINWTLISMTPVDKILTNTNQAALQIIVIGFICLLIGIAMSSLIAKDISMGIKGLNVLMDRIKNGDFEVECDNDRKDEIGNLALSFRDMTGNLKSMIAGVKMASNVAIESSKSVACSSQESYASIEEFSDMLSEVKDVIDIQTRDIEVNGLVIGDLSDQIESTSNDFKSVSKSVSCARELSENGKKSVNKLMVNANEVKNTVAKFGKLIETLRAESSEISKITGFIKGIANQTNMLALNAAIEASKAGEAGRSFSVVASEIKAMAEQSNNSVNYIENKLKNISDTVQLTGEFIKSSDSVMQGHDLAVNDTIDKFDTIVKFMDSIFDQMRDIEKSIHNIDEARISIVEFMRKLTEDTEKTKDNVQSIFSAMDHQVELVKHLAKLSENLNSLSASLEENVSIFRI